LATTLTENYRDAVKEFETLTSRRAATLKNKGKEEGIKKLGVLFKSGKTLEQRALALDAAIDAASVAKADTAIKAFKAIEVAKDKLNEGLKKNIADFTAQAKVLGPADAELKNGFDVFIKRLSQILNRAKMETEQRKVMLKELAGKGLAPDAKLQAEIKTVYLNLRKGCDETEALMKVFIARPTAENFDAAFSSGTGPRSISVAITSWKQIVLKKQPGLASQLRADPEYLLQKIFDLTQRKDRQYWEAKLKLSQPGWEDRAKKVAQDCLNQVKNWRIMADDIKKLAA
jgi:hypothetical protein